jgi:hypothetical protein
LPIVNGIRRTPFWVLGAFSGGLLPKSLPLDPVSALMAVNPCVAASILTSWEGIKALLRRAVDLRRITRVAYGDEGDK